MLYKGKDSYVDIINTMTLSSALALVYKKVIKFEKVLQLNI